MRKSKVLLNSLIYHREYSTQTMGNGQIVTSSIYSNSRQLSNITEGLLLLYMALKSRSHTNNHGCRAGKPENLGYSYAVKPRRRNRYQLSTLDAIREVKCH